MDFKICWAVQVPSSREVRSARKREGATLLDWHFQPHHKTKITERVKWSHFTLAGNLNKKPNICSQYYQVDELYGP